MTIGSPGPARENFEWTDNEYPQAMLTDIVFEADGQMVVGLRDRHIDTGPSIRELYRRAPGDVLRLDVDPAAAKDASSPGTMAFRSKRARVLPRR